MKFILLTISQKKLHLLTRWMNTLEGCFIKQNRIICRLSKINLRYLCTKKVVYHKKIIKTNNQLVKNFNFWLLIVFFLRKYQFFNACRKIKEGVSNKLNKRKKIKLNLNQIAKY